MSEQDNIKASQAFFEAWNAGDLSRDADTTADEFRSEGPGAPGPMNEEEFRAYSQNFLTAFPGSKFEVLRTIAQGDYVVNNWKASGAHAGPLMSPSGAAIPPTGKTVTIFGSTTSEVKNGKVTRSWNYWDMTVMLTQLGLMPPM